jgi:hypothetical protein
LRGGPNADRPVFFLAAYSCGLIVEELWDCAKFELIAGFASFDRPAASASDCSDLNQVKIMLLTSFSRASNLDSTLVEAHRAHVNENRNLCSARSDSSCGIRGCRPGPCGIDGSCIAGHSRQCEWVASGESRHDL